MPTDTAKAFAAWATRQLGDAPTDTVQEQPKKPEKPFTALEAAAPYLPKTVTPPENLNAPAPMMAPELSPRSKPVDAFKSFMEDVVHF